MDTPPPHDEKLRNCLKTIEGAARVARKMAEEADWSDERIGKELFVLGMAFHDASTSFARMRRERLQAE